MTKAVQDSFSANTLSSPNKEIGWREFFILLIYAIGLTTAIYVMRQHLKQLPSLSDSQQFSMLATTEFTGTVAPSKEFKIAASNPAIVKNIFVKIGDRIQPNQPLLALENLAAKDMDSVKQQHSAVQQEIESVKQQQELAKQQVEGLEQKIENFVQTISLNQQLDAADLRVSISQLRSQNVPLRQRQDSIQRSEVVYEQASAQNNRVQKLYREGAVSKAQMEQAQADFQVASSDLASAKAAAAAANNLEQEQIKQWQVQHQLKNTAQQQQLIEMRGQLKLARLQYEQVTRKLEMLRQQASKLLKQNPDNKQIVRATDAGVIVNLPVAAGDQIFTGTNLAGLAKIEDLKVQVPVSASAINSLYIGQRAVVQVGMGRQKFEATIVTINPLPAQNLTYTVEVQFKNSVNALLVGQSAKVHFLSK
ncbi:MAG TPA: hypothetical protein DEV81_14285 [Cyanobacteria bacterium UBA11049]|nr:hypothetical protein [Cyanobacteria bacterium UBA11049]